MSLTGTADQTSVLKGKLQSIPRIDTTLTKAGEAAEAKATGEAITKVATDLKNASTIIATHAEKKNNPHGVTPSQIGAAPAGYGLGSKDPRWVESFDALDKITEAGWYFFSVYGTTICGYTFNFASIFVYPLGGNACVQELRPMQQHTTLKRYLYNGVWSDWVDCSPSAFAPSGYGLGTNEPTALSTLTEVDNFNKSGWARVNLTTGAIEGSSRGTLIVDAGDRFIKQTFVSYYNLFGGYYELVRVWNNTDGWQPWEWVNPPMAIGTEYRTTERWNGKAVYTKLVDFGVLPATDTKRIAVPLMNFVCEISGVIHKEGSYSPVVMGASGELGAYFFASNQEISCTTAKDLSTFSAYVLLKYTKD